MATVKKSKKGKIIAVICIVLAIAVAVAAISVVSAKNKAPQVTLATIGTDDIVEDINSTGTVGSGAVKEYAASTIAMCDEVYVKVGDSVKKGDKLATFKTDELDSQIASLQSSYSDSSSAYYTALKSQRENKKKLDAVNKKIKPLEKKLAKLEKKRAEAASTTTTTTKKASSTTKDKNTATLSASSSEEKKGDSIISGATGTDVSSELEDAVKALEQLAETISKLSDDITTTNEITRQVMSRISEELDKGTYSPESISKAAGEAMSEAIKNGLIDETKLIIDSGVAVQMVEQAVKSVNWSAIGKSIAETENVDYASTELTLAALYAQREIFSVGASTTTLNAQKQAMNAQKQALDTLKRSQSELKAGWIAAIDGVVTECSVAKGEQTSALQTGLKIENLNDMVVNISLGEYDVHKVSVGMPATIKTAYGEYTGEIASIAPTATGASSSSVLDSVGSMAGISGLSSLTDKGAGVQCVVTVNNPDDNIIVGFEANVQIQTGTYSGVPTVPIESIVLEKEGSYVYKYDANEGTVTKTKIEVGSHSDYAYEIKSGLSVGDQIISTPGQDYTEDTFKVKVK